MEIARRDQACPKYGHHVPSRVLARLDESSTEPESLNKHRHHNELGKRRRESPNRIAFLSGGGDSIERFGKREFFVGACIEGFNRCDSRGTPINGSSRLSRLVPFVGEVGAGECLRETLNEDEKRYSGKDDESEEGCAHEGEDEACDGRG